MLFQGDILIKSVLELAIDDLRKNLWLVDDIFSDLVDNPLLNVKYGQKEIERCKEWFLNNKIHFYMKHRIDGNDFPAISISMGSSDEDNGLATLADQSVCVEDLDPCAIDKPIRYIVKPFNIVEYDMETGIITVDKGIEGFQYVSSGMLAVDPETGNAVSITGKISENQFSIELGFDLSSVNKLAIAPQYQKYRARRERITSQESYNIGCHVHGDPSTLFFLFSIVKYALLRYREGLLEYNNFQLSSIKCTDMIKNEAFGADNVFSRFVSLSGQVEESWIKTPQRIIEVLEFKDEDALNGVGIHILSNKNTAEDSEESENDLWDTIEE